MSSDFALRSTSNCQWNSRTGKHLHEQSRYVNTPPQFWTAPPILLTDLYLRVRRDPTFPSPHAQGCWQKRDRFGCISPTKSKEANVSRFIIGIVRRSSSSAKNLRPNFCKHFSSLTNPRAW